MRKREKIWVPAELLSFLEIRYRSRTTRMKKMKAMVHDMEILLYGAKK